MLSNPIRCMDLVLRHLYMLFTSMEREVYLRLVWMHFRLKCDEITIQYNDLRCGKYFSPQNLDDRPVFFHGIKGSLQNVVTTLNNLRSKGFIEFRDCVTVEDREVIYFVRIRVLDVPDIDRALRWMRTFQPALYKQVPERTKQLHIKTKPKPGVRVVKLGVANNAGTGRRT